KRGQNLIGRPQILIDRLGLCGRLDNNDIHVFPITYGKNAGRFRESRAGRAGGYMGKSAGPVKWTSGDRLRNRQGQAPFPGQFHIHMVLNSVAHNLWLRPD
ncbi:hypothetical protein U6T51_12295, partial [Cutibacterium acnes]